MCETNVLLGEPESAPFFSMATSDWQMVTLVVGICQVTFFLTSPLRLNGQKQRMLCFWVSKQSELLGKVHNDNLQYKSIRLMNLSENTKTNFHKTCFTGSYPENERVMRLIMLIQTVYLQKCHIYFSRLIFFK